MIIINPQWQGIGQKNPVPQGAEVIKSLLKDFQTCVMPLDESDIALEDNVKGLSQLDRLIENTARTVEQEAPDSIFTCGGDCTSDFAQLTYLNDKHEGNLTLIWIDAHADLHTPESSPSKNFHGMTLRSLMGNGPHEITRHVKQALNPSQVIFSGLRSYEAEEEKFIADNGIKVFSTKETREGALKNAALPHENVYIHVDIDCLDQSVFNHCATPTSEGFELQELVDILQDLIARYNVVGGCLTEYGPKEENAARNIVETILFKGFRVQDNFTPEELPASRLG
ncbi:MAG: arginase family protein [Alphaproteobacteria bacterium]